MGEQADERSRYATLEDAGIRQFMMACDEAYPADAIDLPVASQRKLYDALCSRFSMPYPPGLSVIDDRVDGVALRVYRPDTADNPPLLIYLHGGGFVVGNLDSHASICAEIADQAGVGVIAVDYRLAPEHRFPAAFDDCWAAVAASRRLAADHRLDAARLVIAGDSAGGNLTAATCLRARDCGGPTIRGQVLIYPGLGGDMTKGSYIQHAQAPGLPAEDIHFYHESYLGPPAHPNHANKYAVPLLETDYSRLPPAFIVAAEWDPLRDDAFDYAARLKAAGGVAHVRHEPLLVHAFLRARHMSDPAAESFAAITAAARSLAYDGDLPRQ